MAEEQEKISLAIEMIRAALNRFTDADRSRILAEVSLPRIITHNMISLSYETIDAALVQHGGDIGASARGLRCSRRTLQSRMRLLGFPPGRSGRKAKRK